MRRTATACRRSTKYMSGRGRTTLAGASPTGTRASSAINNRSVEPFSKEEVLGFLIGLLACHRDRRSARWHGELRQNRRNVVVDRLRRNEQALGDGRIAQTVGQQSENLSLALS